MGGGDIKTLLKDTISKLQTIADEAWGLIESGGRRIRPATIVKGKYSSGPKPGVNWSRILDWGGNIRKTPMGPAAPYWIDDEGYRVEIYNKFLGDNPMPSRIHYNEYVYALTNEVQS